MNNLCSNVLSGLDLRHAISAGIAARLNDSIQGLGYTAVPFGYNLVSIREDTQGILGDVIAEIVISYGNAGEVTLEPAGPDAEWAERLISSLTR